ncbi:MAG TPA: hypothetical protein VGH87_27015 [Polyangiaceae bacterium]|nr:hypothetical protein [Polyangiaceae bacterium]
MTDEPDDEWFDEWSAALMADMRRLKEESVSAEGAWDGLRAAMLKDQGIDIGAIPTKDEGWGFSSEPADEVATARIVFYKVFVGPVATRKNAM